MESKNYEYNLDEEYDISEQRKNALIKSLKKMISDTNTIALHKVLGIAKNDAECDFLYQWLEENDIEIRGINLTMAGELPNYTHIARTKDSKDQKDIEEYYFSVLDKETQERLFRELKRLRQLGDYSSKYYTIRDELITHNMKLARWVANSKSFNGYNISKEDIEGYAIIGLMRGVDHFDVDKGFQFSTYASKAIYYTISREIMQSDRSKFLIMQQINELEEIETQLTNVLQRFPTEQEIADVAGEKVEKISEIKQWREYFSKYSGEIEENIGESQNDYNLEYSEDEENIELGNESEMIMDDTDVENEATIGVIKEQLLKVLHTLTPREEAVLKLRCGFNSNGEPMTLEEVGKEFNITRERIRQIEKRALRKLRHPSRSRGLKDFVDGR